MDVSIATFWTTWGQGAALGLAPAMQMPAGLPAAEGPPLPYEPPAFAGRFETAPKGKGGGGGFRAAFIGRSFSSMGMPAGGAGSGDGGGVRDPAGDLLLGLSMLYDKVLLSQNLAEAVNRYVLEKGVPSWDMQGFTAKAASLHCTTLYVLVTSMEGEKRMAVLDILWRMNIISDEAVRIFIERDMQAVPNPADDRDYYIRVMMRRFRSTYKAVHHHEPSEEREKKLVGRLANIPSASLAILNDISIYDGVAFSSCLTSLGLEPAETA